MTRPRMSCGGGRVPGWWSTAREAAEACEGEPSGVGRVAAACLGVKGAAQRGHLVEEAAHRPDVALGIIRLVVTDLGAHVVRRAARGARQLDCTVEHACNPKVAELEDLAVLREEDVLRLDVSVEHLIVSNGR